MARLHHLGNKCLFLDGLAVSTRPPLGKRKLVVVHDIQILRHLDAPAQYPIDAPRATLRYFSFGMGKALRTADTIITVAQFTAYELVSFAGVRRDRISVIPNGIDHQRFHPPGDNSRLEEVRSRYNLPPAFHLFVGQPTKQKNLHLIVESYASGSLSGEFQLPVVVTCSLRRSALFADTLAAYRASRAVGSVSIHWLRS